MQYQTKTWRNDNFAHLTLILLLHYLVKCTSRSLAVYNTEFTTTIVQQHFTKNRRLR